MRGRITAAASLAVLLVLGGTATALIQTQRFALTDNVDEVLERHSAAIANTIDDGALSAVLPGQGDDESFAQVFDASGKVVSATEFIPPGATSLTIVPLGSSSVRLAGYDYRVLTQQHGDLVIRNGTPLDDVIESADALVLALLVALPLTSLLLAALIWFIVGRVLLPVEHIRQQVAEISGRSLNRRVPVPKSRDEIARLARTMNEMLDRLERASDQQLRFVADASHELRTPLTRIRTQLEVDAAHPTTADLAATHRSLLHDTETLQRLVDDLLVLANSDAVSGLSRREPVDLDDVVLDEVERLRVVTALTVDTSRISGAQVEGDQAQLARVVRNLLDNAARHGASAVTVSLGEHAGEAVLCVEDDGAGIPLVFHETAFERFTRADDARSVADGGAGLGLAIAREIVTAHGGTIVIDDDYAFGARLVVRIPCLTPNNQGRALA